MAADITEVRPVSAQLDAAVPARSRHLGLALVVMMVPRLGARVPMTIGGLLAPVGMFWLSVSVSTATTGPASACR
jgi:hypothetical protein